MLTDSGRRAAGRRGRPARRSAACRVCAGPPDGDGPPPEVAEDPAAPAFLAYTSGTTGRPRGAILTSAALRANQEQCLAMTPPPVRADDRVLLVLPLFHVYGLNAGFGLVAATGACAVLQETFDPRGSLALMAEEQVTAVPGAPPMYQAWLAVADAAGSDAELRRGVRRDAHGLLRRRPAARGGLDGDARPRRRHRLGGLRAHRGVAGRRQHPGHRPGQAELHRRPAARRRARAARHRHHRVGASDAERRGPPGGPRRDLGARPQPVRRLLARRRGRARTPTAGWAPATSPTATPTATCTWSTGAAT